jgi:hypothetical protein
MGFNRGFEGLITPSLALAFGTKMSYESKYTSLSKESAKEYQHRN